MGTAPHYDFENLPGWVRDFARLGLQEAVLVMELAFNNFTSGFERALQTQNRTLLDDMCADVDDMFKAARYYMAMNDVVEGRPAISVGFLIAMEELRAFRDLPETVQFNLSWAANEGATSGRFAYIQYANRVLREGIAAIDPEQAELLGTDRFDMVQVLARMAHS